MLRWLSLTRTMICIALLGILAAWGPPARAGDGFSSAPQDSRWGQSYLPNVEVLDQDGKAFKFYDDLVKDKLVVINFIYTTCTDICPLTTARLAMVQENLGDVIGRDIFMYSITIDPEHDGPKELKRHADAFHVGPGWKFLTGKPADIALIRYKLGERSKALSQHRHEILLGNTKTGEWSRDSAFGDLERVTFNIHSLDAKWRDRVRTASPSQSSNEAMVVANTPGEALFAKACAACHTVGKGERVGPDLLGVAKRRERAWLTKFIVAPDKMLAQKDPTALALVTQYKGLQMPNLQISENDAGDLIAYLEMRTYAFDATPAQAPGSSQHAHDHEHDHHHH